MKKWVAIVVIYSLAAQIIAEPYVVGVIRSLASAVKSVGCEIADTVADMTGAVLGTDDTAGQERGHKGDATPQYIIQIIHNVQ